MKAVIEDVLELAQTVAVAAPADMEGEDELRLAQGELVGRYVVLGQLGEGGMSVVYAAYDPALDRKVALKFMRPRAGGSRQGDYGRQALLREAQALARVVHENVLGVFDVGSHGDRVFLALELIEGQTLADWLTATPRTDAEKLDAFRAAARGLAAAHRAGLVHRDFKPENVLVGHDGRVVVCDFGLAYRPAQGPAPLAVGSAGDEPIDEYRHTLSRGGSTGQVFGTPMYMSPEQHMGLAAEARSDQFAFAVALYEALYGQRPFAGKNVTQVAAAVVGGRLQPAPDGAGAPSWLWAVVERALCVAPAGRFATMDDLLEALTAPAPVVLEAMAPVRAADSSRCRLRGFTFLAALMLVAGGLAGAAAAPPPLPAAVSLECGRAPDRAEPSRGDCVARLRDRGGEGGRDDRGAVERGAPLASPRADVAGMTQWGADAAAIAAAAYHLRGAVRRAVP